MLRGLALMADFPMGADARWRESVGWSVCRFMLRHKPETLPLTDLAGLVRQVRDFVPTEPCLLRSVWWKALLRHQKTGLDWLGLVAQHGWEGGFRPEDEEPETFGEGKTTRPLLEGLVQAVAKQLLNSIVLTPEKTAPWLDRLTDLATRHPDWDFLPYYHARLLLRTDRPAEAMAVFLPFARQKRRDFWVWSLLAELVLPRQQGACLARALSQHTPDAFLVKVRQRAAAWLVGQGRWAEARAEIDRLVQTRQTNQWPVPTEVQRWMNDDHYTQAETVTPGQWCAALLPEADALLWADCPDVVALITAVDPAGARATAVIDGQTTTNVPVGRFGLCPAVGDRLRLRYTKRQKNGRCTLTIHAAAATEAPPTDARTQTVRGPLRRVAGKGFGFVNGVYVGADLLASTAESLADALVRVEAVQAWDTVKQKMGWRAFRIEKESLTLAE